MPEFYNTLLPYLTSDLLIILFIIFLLYLTRRFHLRSTEASYLPILNFARQKRQKRDRIIDSQLASLSNLPNETTQKLILNSTVTELSHLLNQGTITSEQILNTYFYRAATIGRKLELITESNYTEALYLARQCDTVRQQTKPEDRTKLGGLYGIPMSIKDSFFQKGFDTTCGCAVVCFRPSPKDGEIIDFLKSRGAIPFIRSSTTQALQVYDCQNNIWGLACNPWDTTRTVAGSSGGEAGLVAARCSPIGIGSDMRGSLTIPAAFCGLYGIKPTTGRCLAKGHVTFSGYSVSKFNALNLSSGPIGRSVDDLAVFIKELMVEENRKQNVLVPYVPWNEEKFATTRKFKVGYSLTEEFFGASKACQRAIKEAVQALKASGHEVEEIKIPNFERMAVLMMVVMTSEGKGRGLVKSMGGDKPIKGVEEEIAIRALPTYVKKGMRILLQVLGYKRLAGLLSMVEEMTADEYHERMGEYYNAKEELLKFIASNRFDAVITPAAPTPAFKQGHGVEFFIASCYAWPANIANLPSGIVPVTSVREGEEVYKKEDCVHEDFMSKACRDSVKQSKGMPVAVQVMSLPWEDETCLAVMKAIESKIKFRELPPLDI